MSTENGPGFATDNPIADISRPKKSSKKLWIFGGLGCLGLIGLVCIGMIVAGVLAGKPMFEFMNENVTFIESSTEVQNALGTPLTVTPAQPTPDPNNPQALIFRGNVSGPQGSGSYVVEATMKGMTPVRNAVYLELNGEKIDLDPNALDDLTNLEINDGS